MPDDIAAGIPVEKAKKLQKLRADLSALEEELRKLSVKGDKIRNNMRVLIDRVKIAKVKSYINKKA